LTYGTPPPLGFLLVPLQGFVKRCDALPIDLRHVPVQERRSFLGVREQLDQVHAKHPDMVLLHGGSPEGAS